MCQIANHGLIVANTWALQVVANGGPVPSVSTISALADFVTALDQAGVWSKMLDFSFFAPDSLIAATTPAKVTYGSKLWTNNNFAPADLSLNGLVGDGATKYLDSGVNLNKAPAFTGPGPTIFPGLSMYVFADSVAPGQCEMGWLQNGFDFFYHFTGARIFDCYGVGSGRVSSPFGAAGGAFITGNRTSFDASALYGGNSTVPFGLIVSTNTNDTFQGAQDSTLLIFANNNSGVPVQFSRKTLSFAAFHFGLNATQAQALFNAVQALRVALGGGFI